MVKKLYKNGKFLYRMNLVAGKSGLSNLVQWVHIIEDNNVAAFLHGNELVFTAGILNEQSDWLLEFAKKLYAAGTSAFVVNIGPYTKQIPKEVIDYCNKVNLPLFTIPWETKMVDMTRDFCHRIMKAEQTENNAATTLKNIIFNVGDIDAQVLQMERYGYQRDDRFCFVSIALSAEQTARLDDPLEAISKNAERIAKWMHEMFISFTYKENLILVLPNYSDEEISAFVSEMLKIYGQDTREPALYVGISANRVGIYNQKTSFENALSAVEMARLRNLRCCYHEQLGIFKVLYAISDKAVLREYCNHVIGKLEAYDRENKAGLVDILQTYLENNGCLQTVSDKRFVHRNTVTNKLKKIEEITGYNPLDLKDKVELCMALYIKEIL